MSSLFLLCVLTYKESKPHDSTSAITVTNTEDKKRKSYFTAKGSQFPVNELNHDRRWKTHVHVIIAFICKRSV